MDTGVLLEREPDGTARLEFELESRDAVRSWRKPLVQVAEDREADQLCVLIGRLHYLDPAPEGVGPIEEDSHAAHALRAYQTGGRTALENLEGDFSLIVHDNRHRVTLALRDPFGAWPLYWTTIDSRLLIGTRLSSLTRRVGTRDYHLEYFAEYLMQPRPVCELPTEDTPYRGIRRILPGWCLDVNRTGNGRHRCYWNWESRVTCVESRGERALAEHLEHLLVAAVRQRMLGERVAAHLSGGLDSTSVACIAGDLAPDRRDRGRDIQALSLVYGDPTLAGERRFVELAARHAGNIRSLTIPADDLVNFDWFSEPLPRHDEPFGGLREYSFQRQLVQTAHKHGATMILTGLGSDELFACPPHRITRSIRRGRWLSAARESSRWARSWGVSAWTILFRFGIEPFAPLLASDGIRAIGRGGLGRWPRLGWFHVPDWVRATFARQLRLAARGRRHARLMRGSGTSLSADLPVLATSNGDWQRWYLAGPHGINISHPFRDPRIVCFALGLARTLREVPCMSKPLLRRAVRGRIPGAICDRRQKNGFDSIYGRGLHENAHKLTNMIHESPINQLGLFDAKRLIEVLQSAVMGTGDPIANERLDKTLALIAWYARAEAAAV